MNNVDFLPGHKVSAEEWNNMFNLSRLQGNNNAKGIELILETMGDSVALPSILDDYDTRITEMQNLVSDATNKVNDFDAKLTEEYVTDLVSKTYVTKTELQTESTKISTLTEKVNTVEQKVTDEAITNVVSSEFYKKTEVDDKMLEQTQGLESKISQEAGAITASVNSELEGFDSRLEAAEVKLTADSLKVTLGDYYATSAAVTEIDTKLTEATEVINAVELEVTTDAIMRKISNQVASKSEVTALDESLNSTKTDLSNLSSAVIQTNNSVGSVVSRVTTIEQDYVKQSDLPTLEDGKSAYQIWLEAGNTGTEADFLASLQGETGNGIASSTIQYQIAEDGVNIPTGTWENAPQQTTAEKPYLWTKTVLNYTDGTSSNPVYAVGASPEGVEETTEARIRQEIAQLTTTINQTAENIVLGVQAEYTTKDELESYSQEVAHMLNISEEGFDFRFTQLSESLSAVGGQVSAQQEYIRFINGEIHIGRSGNPVTSVYTNNALEFRYNGVTVAKFTNETLEVRNITSENQIAFFGDWAIRKGAEVSGKGYNLNDIWIGG